MERSELVSTIRELLNPVLPDRAIVFGSLAKGEFGPQSDIDLVVVLPRDTPFESFDERLKAVTEIRRLLNPLIADHGLDLLVFTRPDWKRFIAQESWFSKEIVREGLQVA